MAAVACGHDNPSMFESLTDLFNAIRPATAEEAAAEQQRSLELAAAVLLVEVMRADPTVVPAERGAAALALREQFGLGDADIDRLLASATDASRHANDYFTFTSRINDGFDMTDKVKIMEHLWRVAYADGHLDAAENHVMRRLCDLLYIPQGVYINAKLRARDAAGSH